MLSCHWIFTRCAIHFLRSKPRLQRGCRYKEREGGEELPGGGEDTRGSCSLYPYMLGGCFQTRENALVLLVMSRRIDDRCFGGLVVITLAQNVRDQGLIPHWGTEFFYQNPQLHLTPNYGIHRYNCLVKAWGHAFPRWGWMSWQTDDRRRLGGLMVIMLDWNMRDQCSIPRWGIEFFRRNPLLQLHTWPAKGG